MPDAPLPNCFPPQTVAALPQGQHSGLAPYLLGPQQCSFAVNTTFRGGYATTRPIIAKLALAYADEDVQLNLRAWFQGAGFYQSLSRTNRSCLLAGVGGRLFRFLVNNQNVVATDITPRKPDGMGGYTPDLNDPNQKQVWMAQGQDFMVVNDGQSLPWFFDGGGTRRSLGEAGKELPPGKMIHYSNGRFIEVLSEDIYEGVAYIASDLVYNTQSGTPQYNYRDSILRTTDNEAILAGQAFAVPLTAGPITALFTTAVSDTSLGQGPLQVSTGKGIYSVNLPLDATLWTTTQQPSQVVALSNGGPSGGYAVTTVNGDAWYRSYDGIRSFSIARRDFNTWVQTPLSFEMARILPYDQPNLLPWGSVANFDNRLLCTCSPYPTSRGIAHRGLAVIDFNNISSLTSRSQPCYDGLWTGLPILQMVRGAINGVERCFLFALDAAGDICLYELGVDNGGWFDNDGTRDVPIQSYIETASLFGREMDPLQLTQTLKKLHTADFWWEQLFGPASVTPSGTVSFSISYRSDQYPFWVAWNDWTLCAPACYTPSACSQPLPVQQQYATYKRLPEPADSACNTLTGRPMRMGYNYQLKIQWTGHAMLHHMNLWASPSTATRNTTCTPGTCVVLAGCLDNPFTYLIESGAGTGGNLEWDVATGKPTWDVGSGSTITPT